MVRSVAIYDLVSGVLRGRVVATRTRRAAFGAPVGLWRRVLGYEGCEVPFARALRVAGLADEAAPELRRFLRDATGESLRRSMLAMEQLASIAEVAERHGIRIVALKGAARLLTGMPGGRRSIADIDLLATPADAARLHRALQLELGHAASGHALPHHLPPLTRAGALPIEIHVRLSEAPMPLDAAMMVGTSVVAIGRASLEVPSPTNVLLHTLEHATALNWMNRYRLRDIIDTATCHASAIDRAAVDAYVQASPRRVALEILLSAANAIETRVFASRPDAWRTVTRVGRARLAVAVPFGRRDLSERLFRYAGVIAEGSPSTLGRAALTGVRWLGRRRWARNAP